MKKEATPTAVAFGERFKIYQRLMRASFDFRFIVLKFIIDFHIDILFREVPMASNLLASSKTDLLGKAGFHQVRNGHFTLSI